MKNVLLSLLAVVLLLIAVDVSAVNQIETPRMRRFGHAFPLLAVTARADGDAERQAQAAGFDGFLRKPVTADMLVEAIAAAQVRADRQPMPLSG